MMNLGLLFLKRSDKQTWFRYIVMIVAIMLSMAMLLSSVAIGNATTNQMDRANWRVNILYNHNHAASAEHLNPEREQTLLSLNETDYSFNNKKASIKELGIRQISPNSPLIPGTSRQPAANEIFVSKSLMELINSEPILKERYSNYQISLGVPDELLSSPDEKMLFYQLPDEKITVSELNHNKRTATFGNSDLNDFKANPETMREKVVTAFMLICGLGVCFPMLTLLISAMRIGMVQREKRYAALSLIGTSKKQVNQIILMEALSSTALGVVFGLGLYQLLRISVLANLHLDGSRFFLSDISVSAQNILLIIALIFAITIFVNFLALRKVKSSPLGVAKIQKLPKRPSFLRLLPATATIFATWQFNQLGSSWFLNNAGTAMIYLAAIFLSSMVSLLIIGPYFTYLFAKIFSKFSRGMIGTLVSKRLKIFAKTIFASVSGVVLALFVGSFLFTTISSVEHTFSNRYANNQKFFDLNRAVYKSEVIEIIGEDAAINRILDDASKHQKLSNMISEKITKKLIPNAVPYSEHQWSFTTGELYTCAELEKFTIAVCDQTHQPTDQVVLIKDYEKNNYRIIPFDQISDQTVREDSTLVRFKTSANAELGREYLRNLAYEITRKTNLEVYIYRPTATVLDALSSVSGLLSLVEMGTVLTIIVAGLSVTVSAIGGIFERKKSFSNLKLLGISNRQLFLVVLFEAIIPMVLSSALAVICGILSAKYLALITGGGQILFALPNANYLILVLSSLVGSIFLIFCTLPVLKQVTSVEQNRTE